MPYRLKISSDDIEAELRNLGFGDVPEDTVERLRKDVLKLIKQDALKSKQHKHNIVSKQLPCTIPEAKISHGRRVQNSEAILQPPVTSTPLPDLHGLSSAPISRSRRTNASCSEESGYSDTESYTEDSHTTTSTPTTSSFSSFVSGYSEQSSTVQQIKEKRKESERPGQSRPIPPRQQPTQQDKVDAKFPKTGSNQKTEITNYKKPSKKGNLLPTYPKKVDPVNLYQYYRAHWDKFKVPGEDPRAELRWDVRTKLFYSQ